MSCPGGLVKQIGGWGCFFFCLVAVPQINFSYFQCNFISVSSFNLEENQTRWVVIGICLNRLLLPFLRDFVGKEMHKHYASLKSVHGIDTQVYGGHLTRDGRLQLNYGSINNNWGNFKKNVHFYDYRVGTAEDLAKLYLEPHMAKFTGYWVNWF